MKIHQTPTPPAVCGPFRYSTGGWLIFVWRMKKNRKVLSQSFATVKIDWIFIAWLSHLVRWQMVERVRRREASMTRPEEKNAQPACFDGEDILQLCSPRYPPAVLLCMRACTMRNAEQTVISQPG